MFIRHLFRRSSIYKFSTFDKFLSTHTNDILVLNPQKYQQCKGKMQKITLLSISQQQIKKRLNIVFSIANLSDVYQKIRPQLYRLVVQGDIKSQSDLDRLTKWMNSEFRINNQINEKDLTQRLKTGNSQRLMNQRLEQYQQKFGKQIDISQLSKKIRQQFPAISSKDIYTKITQRFKNKTQKQTKQIWNKLSQLKPRLLSIQTNTPQQTKEHLKITDGKLRFRFPPEPNGYLHIGHAKSIRINFQTAKQKQGVCFLRFDDTNPEAQSQQFIDNIKNEVKWMGYTPYKITYASDYFDNLIEYAKQLIKQGDAYVCETPKQQINEQRKNKKQNPFRNKPIEYSLNKFPNLKDGQVLRLKLNPKASNPTLRDPIIFRYKESPHPRTGNKYKIYPTYDFAHCLCDSIQHIDYSLCSLEFEIRRQLYYTILDLLKLFKPTVWQYSRLNIEGSLLSKRKIMKLIKSQQVNGWDDPRLMTLTGLRNRGYSPSMISNFVDKINSSRTGNENVVKSNLLTLQMKKELFDTAERTMCVLQPKHLIITNSSQKQLTIPLFPFDLERGFRKLKINNELFIQNNQNIKQGSIIGLKYIGTIKITQINPHLQGQLLDESVQKSKIHYVHWVPSSFKQQSIFQFSSLIDTNSEGEQIFNQDNTKQFKALIPIDLDENKIYQFQRLGYYRFYNGKLICCCRL